MPISVAIVGRPNVGKSTLFNRLVGKRIAIVDDTPGVTRDRREGVGHIDDFVFTVIDTAGFEENNADNLNIQITNHTKKAVKDADISLFVIDAKLGLTPFDKSFAIWLRKYSVPVIVVSNKCEGNEGQNNKLEASALGFGNPIAISAEHGEGISDLGSAIKSYVCTTSEQKNKLRNNSFEGGTIEDEKNTDTSRLNKIALIGRPNVGKSTLLNKLVGMERVLTGPQEGITRDSIGVTWNHKGYPVTIFDTAGLRRKSKITKTIEAASIADSLRTVRLAQVVILVLDAGALLEKQDLTIARFAIDTGRGLLIAVNKWDKVTDRTKAFKKLNDKILTSLPQVTGIPTITLSALKDKNIDKVLDLAFKVFHIWSKRIPTGVLNRWLKKILIAHPPPIASHGRRINIRYVTQAKSQPPTFIFFSSTVNKLPDSYFRYLKNSLRADFGIVGVPIRLQAQKSKNPYD